jgi:type I restriction enzyme, R subunit
VRKATPEEEARELIDACLDKAGWIVQNRDEMNLAARQGVAVREFKLARGHGFADYLLFVDERAVGALEAKPKGHTLKGVEVQSGKYSEGLSKNLTAPVTPLPFLYESTGVETQFTNRLDPQPRSRTVFSVHRPETLAEWLTWDPLRSWAQEFGVAETAESFWTAPTPSSFRGRVRAMPPLNKNGLWPNQVKAITNLEASFAKDRPRALLQMATGSGKTFTAINAIYRLVKFGGARRIVFLVDRTNLGEQAEDEFAKFVTPDDRKRFTDLYVVQRLSSNTVRDSARVVITTIQRLYSMIRGEAQLDPAVEQGSEFDAAGERLRRPVEVAYSEKLPPEFFDIVFVDECHRSIYSLWRQVLDYFDAFIVGLTATPAKHTFGFFNRNLVMEYGHEQAVADHVNVDFDVYRIRTRISGSGSTIEAGPDTVVGLRDRETREVRWEKPDEDITYGAEDLDRGVVSRDQIRTIVRTFKERLFTEIFPDRTEVPKTLVFAKSDSHADDIVGVIREEFDKGNEFCQKITYRTTGAAPKDLIQEFRISFNPRIAVTVDMIATGTDIKPVEIVVFMRSVKSRVYFEQMKGRGVRVIDEDDLRKVTPDAKAKTHFVIVDCVGVCETELADTRPLDRNPSVSFDALLEHVAAGGTDGLLLSSLASRLARLDRRCGQEERAKITAASGGTAIPEINRALLEALNPDRQVEEARKEFGLAPEAEPTADQIKKTAERLCKEAVRPLATNPPLRKLLRELKTQFEQVVDDVSRDEVLDAGLSPEAQKKAEDLVTSFEKFLEENKSEIDALQFFYSRPHRDRLRFEDVKALAEAIKAPPRAWTPERLWKAYETLDKSRVRGAAPQRLLTDVVSLVRFALHQEDELVPFADRVHERFKRWQAIQEAGGKQFTPEQVHWLEMIRDHVARSLEVDIEDFDLSPFAQEGGLAKAVQVFGKDFKPLLAELNEALAA